MNTKKKTLLLIVTILIFFSGVWWFNAKHKEINELSCINNAKKFLLWYKDNFTQINEVENSLVKTENVEYYRVDFNESDKFLALLKSSGYISNFFLEKLKEYINNSEQNLQKIKQKDGPPEGFDFDLILLTQEYAPLLENIPVNIDIKLKEEENDTKIIIIDGRLLYTFNKSCKLENIGLIGRETSHFY